MIPSSGIRQIQQLGKRLAAVAARSRLSPNEFATIAERSLLETGKIGPVDLKDAAEFLCSGEAPLQSSITFSDIPLIVFRHPDFYIEILHWMHATTAVHGHSFAGAFRVLRGSSIHTPYRVTRVDMVERDLALVDAQSLGSELLQVGDVRRIMPEHDGLVHSLYHLEVPSLSLVVRTYGDRDQFSLYRPRIWLNDAGINKSDHVRILGRCLRAAELTRRGDGIELLKLMAATLDRSRWLHLLLSNSQLIDSQELPGVLAARDDLGSELTDAVVVAFEHARVADLIGRARVAITDSDLRFFLALLLNVQSRADLLNLVARRYPDVNPVLTCATWIVKLSRFRGDPRERLARIAAAANIDHRVGVLLREAVGPDVSELDAIGLVGAALGLSEGDADISGDSCSTRAAQTSAISQRLRDIAMLQVLLE